MTAPTLESFLRSGPPGDRLQAVAATLEALASAAVRIGEDVRSGAMASLFGAERGTFNADGEAQKNLDIHADTLILDALRRAPVRCVGSEEQADPILLNLAAPLAVATDPLDGSSNIDCNGLIGTIFSILPADGPADQDPADVFLQRGRRQLAAGLFIYGPQLTLVLSLGHGTHGFIYSPAQETFVLAFENLRIADQTTEFAINVANYRHWEDSVQLYLDDCLKGRDGPRRKDFNMRWLGAVAAEAYKILIRGGVYLYPRDARAANRQGRLRLVYEANPIALLVEQAGGLATDTRTPILDLEPESLHQRVPLVFGAAAEVELIGRYHSAPSLIADRSPLFGNRGLFRT